MGRRRKDKTISGQRIPYSLYESARRLKKMMESEGKKYSLQDAYRKIAKRRYY